VALEPEEFFSGSPAMIELYSEGESTPIACSVGPFNAAGNLTTYLSAPLSPGRYSVQLMTAVKSGEDPAGSLEEHWRVTASFAPNLDLDGDGYPRPGDCRDDNPAIHPGAVDVPDNGIDENCDGQDAKRDSDGDGVPDYRDRCPAQPSEGIDSNGDGCRDPQPLQLTAQVRLTLSRGQLHVASLLVRSEAGARAVLACEKGACGGESQRVPAGGAQFGDAFLSHIPDRTEMSLSATKAGYLGVVKQYRLSVAGLRLLRQWCTTPGKPAKKVSCG
jgi:hypothetical protein